MSTLLLIIAQCHCRQQAALIRGGPLIQDSEIWPQETRDIFL